MIRIAHFANSWYPGGAQELEKAINEYMPAREKRVDALSALVPHAGYIYSGKTAGELFASINIPENVIILSPNHTGFGKRVAIFKEGEWQIPDGDIKVNSEIADLLISKSDLLEDDVDAHINEHSIELELPFLYYRNHDVKIVPITLKHLSATECFKIGDAISEVVRNYKERILILASSDMSHGESLQNTEKKDNLAVSRMLAIDPVGLYETVVKNRISMCGFIPATIMLYAAKKLGGERATLAQQTNSYSISGRRDYIVGYASLYIE